MADQPTGLANPTTAEVTQARRLALAFQSVFGTDFRRSSDQRLVMAHLAKVGCKDALIFVPDSQGRYDPYAASQRDGARSIILIIERQLAIAGKVDEPAKKPKVTKST